MTIAETTAAAAGTGMTMASIILDNLRRAGWTVAVHNDFRLKGEPHTFWLLTNEATKRYVKGEGRSDQEALEECAHEAAMFDEPIRIAEPRLALGVHPQDANTVRHLRAMLVRTRDWLRDCLPQSSSMVIGDIDETLRDNRIPAHVQWPETEAPSLPGLTIIDLTTARKAVAAGMQTKGMLETEGSPDAGLVATLTTQLGLAIRTIEEHFGAPDEFEDAAEAGDALRAGAAAFVGLESYQKLLQAFHDEHHEGPLATCPVEICAEGRGHLPRKVSAQ